VTAYRDGVLHMCCNRIAEPLACAPGAFSIATAQGLAHTFVEGLVGRGHILGKCLPIGHEGQGLAQVVGRNQTTEEVAGAFGAAIQRERIKKRPLLAKHVASMLAMDFAEEVADEIAHHLALAFEWNIAQDAVIASSIARAYKKVRCLLDPCAM
jgi:hypothetical protein